MKSIPILMYHQIDAAPPRGTPLRGLIVTPLSFALQMQLLKRFGYQGLSMRALEPYLTGEKKGKVFGITFDDGYQNNLLYALPILNKLNFTATCYGVARMLGASNTWDRGKVSPKQLMTKDEMLSWRDAGMDIGSHTLTHSDLENLSQQQAHYEIVRSKHELSELMQYEVRHFCYPYGRYKLEHVEMVRDTGYMTATTTKRGRVNIGDDLFQLKRIMIACATNPLQFLLKTMTSYEDSKA